jgi:NAD(P)-dependent dehydrogenase (short-subunit alcohol dehydrogenase family)
MKDMIIVGSQGAIGNWLVRAFAPKCMMYGTFHENLSAPHRGRNCKLHRVDVRVPGSCVSYADTIKKELGPHIVLVNAFGVSIDGTGHRLGVGDWREVYSVNLEGVFNVCQAFLPIMQEKGWGRIINLSSVVGRVGVRGTGAYAASKAGVEALTRALAVENVAYGITANSLVLGYMALGMIGNVPVEHLDALLDRIPMGKFGHPDNIVAAVQFLIDADYVTGASIVIDGGFLCT